MKCARVSTRSNRSPSKSPAKAWMPWPARSTPPVHLRLASPASFPQSSFLILRPARARDYVELTFDAPGGSGGFDLLDDTGASLPYETSGLGSQDLVNISMQPDEFTRSISMVSEGRVAGMTLQAIDIHREGSQVFIEVVLSDKPAPNLAAWLEGVEEIKASLGDPTVTVYHVHARSAAATHLAFSAADVPGFGYRTFWARGKPAHQPTGKPPIRLGLIARAFIPLAARLARSPLAGRLFALLSPKPENRPPYIIENEFLHVEAAQDGTLLLTDKRSGATYPGLNRFVDGGDGGDEYNYSPPVRRPPGGCQIKARTCFSRESTPDPRTAPGTDRSGKISG